MTRTRRRCSRRFAAVSIEERRSGTIGAQAALTARKRGFETAEAYAEWIAADARKKIGTPIDVQLHQSRLRRDRSVLGRTRQRLAGFARRLRSAG